MTILLYIYLGLVLTGILMIAADYLSHIDYYRNYKEKNRELNQYSRPLIYSRSFLKPLDRKVTQISLTDS